MNGDNNTRNLKGENTELFFIATDPFQRGEDVGAEGTENNTSDESEEGLGCGGIS